MTPFLFWLADTTLKGSAIILIVALLQRMFGARVDARWRHLLWIVVLLRLVVPDLPSSSLSIFNLLPERNPIVIASPGVTLERAPAALATEFVHRSVVTFGVSPFANAMRWAFWIWLAGALLLASRTLIATLRMHLAVRRVLRANPFFMNGLTLVECDFVRTPALHGLFRPVLLLPRGFRDSFTADELRHVVLHERWHLKRMDIAVSWLLSAAVTIHWFNPLMWFAASRIREERELSCDELALSLLEEEERLGYGRTILKLLERFRAATPVPALVGIVNDKQKMKRRLTMIASFQKGTRFTALFLMLVATVGVMALTDAPTTERRFHFKLDPAAAAAHEQFRQRVTFSLTNASFSDLLTAVSNQTGKPVIQEPQLATLAVQQARFTIDVVNVPLHAVLMEALSPFELSARPSDSGLTITDQPAEHRIMISRSPAEEIAVAAVGSEPGEKHVIRIRKNENLKDSSEIKEHVVMTKVSHDTAAFDEAGTLRREMTISIEENGVKSEGKLTLEIRK